MSATIRTLIYAGVAVVMAGAAYVTHRLTLPPDLSGFERVGQKFFPKFDDPDDAARLRVAAYDELNQSSRVFTVEKHGESWRIPSHHDYPAEAKEQLARTAASVMGLERSAVASRRKTDHERLGVIDPLDEDATALRGRGQRITLYDEGGKTLIDLIVGKAIEGEENQYFVRVPTEKETYRTKFEVELSTKFADWIEPDLLKLSGGDIVLLEVAETVYEERLIRNVLGGVQARRVPVGKNVVARLTREESFGDWTMENVNHLTEELDDFPVRDAVSALDDLKIEGVRPKMQGITADLKVNFPPDVRSQPELREPFIRNLQADLDARGFEFAYDEDENLFVASPNGEVTAATNEGAVYHLHFGSEIIGTEEEIQVGKSSEVAAVVGEEPAADDDPDGPNGGDGDNPAGDNPNGNNPDGDNPAADSPGRFLFVRVEFDPQFIGPEPVPPVEPEKPAEIDEPPESGTNGENSGDASGTGDAQPDASNGSNATQPDDGSQPGSEAPPNDADSENDGGEQAETTDQADDEKSAAQAAYQKALSEYEEAKRQYETDKADYDEKVEEGQKLVQRLNERFKEWYYVVPAESYDKLQLSRDVLVKPQESSVLNEEPVEAPLPPAEDSAETE